MPVRFTRTALFTILAWNRQPWTPCHTPTPMATSAPNAGEDAAGAPGMQGRFTYPLHRCDTVGKLIVYHRELKGWSQKQLVYATGLCQSRLSSLERGERKPRWDELDRIAFFLEQPLDAFSLLRRRPPQLPRPGTEPAL